VEPPYGSGNMRARSAIVAFDLLPVELPSDVTNVAAVDQLLSSFDFDIASAGGDALSVGAGKTRDGLRLSPRKTDGFE